MFIFIFFTKQVRGKDQFSSEHKLKKTIKYLQSEFKITLK